MIDIDRHVRVAKRAKETIVDESHGMVDLLPIVEHYRDGATVATVHAAGPREDQRIPLPMVSTNLGAAGWSSDGLVIVAEIVTRRRVPGEAPPRRGALLEDFSENPLSVVREALQILAVEGDQVQSVKVPYCYSERDGGGVYVSWDAEHRAEQLTGPTITAFRDALHPTDAALQVWATLGIDQLDRVGADVAVAATLARMFGHGILVSGVILGGDDDAA